MIKLNNNTKIISDNVCDPIKIAITTLHRDIAKTLTDSESDYTNIYLVNKKMENEMFEIIGTKKGLEIQANDELGFIYGIYEVSKTFLGINEFWFWNDQVIVQKKFVTVEDDFNYKSKPFHVELRGWFANDEVLLHNWQLEHSKLKPWEMVFETLLRLRGNMIIPGTGQNSENNRDLASKMGLYISHHHAEPLGAKMFSNVYPELNPSYSEHPEKFKKIWIDGIKSQEKNKVVWNLGFRGQGDCPFWESDPRFATSEERGKLISDLTKLQFDLVKEHRPNDKCCINLYGEVLELYRENFIDIPEEIIKIWADNGYGKMVSRRQNNHNPRISSFPLEFHKGKHGIYYHVSFYDLQAANHITMLPNDPQFILNELNTVFKKNMNKYWMINCSNVKPHAYYLDFIAELWANNNITVMEHQNKYIEKYYSKLNLERIKDCFNLYFESAIQYGKFEDEHAGEQFINHVPRMLITQFLKNPNDFAKNLIWATGEIDLKSQINWFRKLCEQGVEKYSILINECNHTNLVLVGAEQVLFKDSILLHSNIYYYCYKGALELANSLLSAIDEDYQRAFYCAGKAREYYLQANMEMRNREHGKWNKFYENECLTDIKQTAWVLETFMGYVRNLGDGPHYYNWQREFLYTEEERKVMLILNMENHLKDLELFELMKVKFES